MSLFPLSYIDLINFYERKGCHIQLEESTYNDNITKISISLHRQYKYNVVMRCGHKRTITFNGFDNIQNDKNYNCTSCNIDYNYQNIKKRFESHGFIFDISENIFHNIINESSVTKSHTKFNILCTCGHRREIATADLREYTSNKCIKCNTLDTNEKLKNNVSSTEIPATSQGEYDSFLYFKNIIKVQFDILLLNSGTKADCIVRPKNEEKWIQVQLKQTVKANKNKAYIFTTHRNNYEHMILACICVKDNKIWFVDPEVVKKLKGFGISPGKNTKYSKYSCEIENVCDTLKNFYKNDYYTKVSIEEANSSACAHHIQEQDFIKLREEKISFLKYEYNPIQGLRHDFIVNGKKVQEKANNNRSSSKKYESYRFFLRKSGKKNNKKTKVPYERGDNDLYWLHMPSKEEFYLIPESVLIEIGCIKTSEQDGHDSILLYPDEDVDYLMNKKIKTAVLNNYLFDYDYPDEERIKELFDITC